MIDPRVKSQARGQNNGSRALKWGIVHLCGSITLRDTTSFIKIWVFQILRFCKKNVKIAMQNCKICKNLRILHILFLIISPKPYKLQSYMIPHFKALDLLFWPLTWLLTLGSIIFAVWSKTFVHFFLTHPLKEDNRAKFWNLKSLLDLLHYYKDLL